MYVLTYSLTTVRHVTLATRERLIFVTSTIYTVCWSASSASIIQKSVHKFRPLSALVTAVRFNYVDDPDT